MATSKPPLIQLSKILLGILAVLPLLFIISYFARIWIPDFLYIPEVMTGIQIGLVAMFVFFLVHLIRVETLGWRSKALWLLRFVIAYPVALPIFWYYFIWRAEEFARWDESEMVDTLIDEIGTSDTE